MSLPRPAGLLGVTLAVTALVGAATVTRPTARATSDSPEARPVQGVTLVCPDVPAPTADLSTATVVATSRPGDGVALVSRLGDPAPPLRFDLHVAAQPVTLPVGAPLVVTASGPASGGLVVTRTTRGASGRDRGYSVDACTPPRTDAWFVGPSTAAGQGAALHLVNAEAGTAQVSVRALSKDGPVEPVGLTGLVIPGHTARDVPMEQLAPLQPALAVEVVASQGRVASSVREYRGLGAAKPGGVDAVPQAAGPEATVTIAGVVGLAGSSVISESRMRQVLTVAVPGARDATVRVEVTDPTGRIVPVGLDAVTVAAGTTRQVDLTPSLTQERATVRVVGADGVGVLAGILVDAQVHIGDVHETLQLGATPALVGPTVVPDTRVGKDLDTFLGLTSPERDTTVVVTAGGVVAAVPVPAGRVVVYKAHVGSATGGALTVTPAAGSPPLWASAVIEELGYNGPLLGGTAVSGGLADVVLPPARPDPGVPLVDSRR